MVAVGSRDAERARAFADRFGIPAAYGSYAELVADDAVDIVYVASPHSGHFEQTLQAIEAGLHVLVEKAFTRNAREAERLIEAARERGVFLMEAMWTRFLPHIDVVRQVLDSGLLGEVHTVTADHGQPMAPETTPASSPPSWRAERSWTSASTRSPSPRWCWGRSPRSGRWARRRSPV